MLFSDISMIEKLGMILANKASSRALPAAP
jgi:hypothetical protein